MPNRIGALQFFHPANRQFLKDFICSHMSRDLFFGYDLAPSAPVRVDEGSLIDGTYSTHQLLNAYLNLERESSIFADNEVNAHFPVVFRYNFFNNFESYQKMLQLCKAYPKLYTIMAHREAIESVISLDEQKRSQKSRDQMISEFFIDNFDISIILKGIQEIIEDMGVAVNHQSQESQNAVEAINPKLCSRQIASIIHNTYFEITDINSPTGYKNNSHFSLENSKKLFSLLLQKAPLLVATLSHIGSIASPVEEVRHNLFEYIDQSMTGKELIHHFLFPQENLHDEYFSLYSQPVQNEKNSSQIFVQALFEGLLSAFIKNNDLESINYLIYLLEQNTFLTTGINYDYKNSSKEINQIDKKNYTTQVISYLGRSQEVKELLAEAKLKIELDKSLTPTADSSGGHSYLDEMGYRVLQPALVTIKKRNKL